MPHFIVLERLTDRSTVSSQSQPFDSGRPDYLFFFFSSVHKPYVRRVSVMVRTFHGLSVFNHNQWVRLCSIVSSTSWHVSIYRSSWASKTAGKNLLRSRIVSLNSCLSLPIHVGCCGSLVPSTRDAVSSKTLHCARVIPSPKATSSSSDALFLRGKQLVQDGSTAGGAVKEDARFCRGFAS